MNEQAPTEPAEPEVAPSLADRLGHARVEMRADLEVSRHVFRGTVSYVIQDPLTFQSHRFSATDYFILTCLTLDRSLNETFEFLVANERLQRDDEERYYKFLYGMHRFGFLKLPVSDEATLYKRHIARQEQKRKGRVMRTLFWQIPLWNPDQFLSRTMRYVRPFCSRAALAAWCLLVATALWLVVRNWGDFQRPATDIFSGSNLPLLWVTLIVLKVAHEFGHAYACKYYGGHVPEMGAYLILFTPCAFVDTTAAWSFARTRDRLMVNLAGMYVEVAIGALAVIVWSVIAPGFARSALHNVVILSSVVTIGFNINPLMRYDGYYVLSDMLQIPNLRARSQDYALSVLKRWTLGVPISERPESRTMRGWLLGFGVASALYKAVLVLGISIAIATKFFFGGLMLGAFYFGSEFIRICQRLFPYLLRSEEAAQRRLRALSYSLLLTVALPIFVVGFPVPSRVVQQGVVVRGTESVLRAEASGFLRELPIRAGDVIEAGALVAELSEPDKQANLAMTLAELDAARLRHRVYEVANRGKAEQETGRIRQLERKLAYLRGDLARLRVEEPRGGLVVECIDRSEVGRFVKRGERIATVTSGNPMVRVLLTEEDVAKARPQAGMEIEFRPFAATERVWSGIIRRIVPRGTHQLDEIFMDHLDLTEFALHPVTLETSRSQFEIEIELEAAAADELLHGMTGRLRLAGESETFGALIYRKLVLFTNKL